MIQIYYYEYLYIYRMNNETGHNQNKKLFVFWIFFIVKIYTKHLKIYETIDLSKSR